MMTITEEQARTIIEAFDKLQMEDLLSHDQWLCAIAIMDFYRSLNQEYFYLRDPYGESKKQVDYGEVQEMESPWGGNN
jgi:hypothetical protein